MNQVTKDARVGMQAIEVQASRRVVAGGSLLVVNQRHFADLPGFHLNGPTVAPGTASQLSPHDMRYIVISDCSICPRRASMVWIASW
jgi:hypothetical protein